MKNLNTFELAKQYYELWIYMHILRRIVTAPDGLAYPTNLNALLIIFRQKQCSLKKLCFIMGMKPSAGSALLNNMVKDGLVIREPSVVDRREISISLTERGKSLAEGDYLRRVHAMEDFLSTLSSEDQGNLMNALNILKKIHLKSQLPFPEFPDIPHS